MSSWPLRESISEPIGTVATPLIGTKPLIGAFCATRARSLVPFGSLTNTSPLTAVT